MKIEGTVGFIGTGNMAEALIRGLLNAGVAAKEQIVGSDPREERRTEMAGRYGIRVVADNLEVAKAAEILVLSVKPQPNRRALDETLARQSGAYAVAMVDVDHFKQFNDTHGHDAGDRVLVAVARALAHTPRAYAFRFGGEEFCLLFRHSDDAGDACEVARSRVESLSVTLPRKRAKAGAPRPEKPKNVQVTVSIGVARREPGRDLPDEALKRADQALYKAKAKGRNQVVLDKMRA